MADRVLKQQNEAIYNSGRDGFRIGAYGYNKDEAERRAKRGLEARLDALFGPNRALLEKHRAKDPVIGEILIADAVRTGHWRELPEELRREYCRRMDEHAAAVPGTACEPDEGKEADPS